MAKSAILSVRIVGDSDDARRKIKKTEDSLDRLGRSAARSSVSMHRMHTQLDRASRTALKVGAVTTAVLGLTVASARAGKAIAPLAGVLAAVPGAAGGGAAAVATLTVATRGFGEAVGAATEGGEKFAEATKGMAPAMVSAAKAVSSMGRSFKVVQNTVQESFWKGLDRDISALGKKSLPTLLSGMDGVAKASNGAARALLKASGTSSAMGALASSFKLAERTINNLTPAIGPFVDGLNKIVKASADMIPGFKGAGAAAESFNAWAEKITSNGQLEQWFVNGKKAVGDLVEVLKQAGRVIAGVSKAALDASGDGGGLGGFADALKRIADEINKPEIQSKLRDAFVKAGQIISMTTTILLALLPTIIQLGPAIMVMAAGWRAVSLSLALFKAATLAANVVMAIMGATATRTLAATALGWAKAGAAAMAAGAKMAVAWLLGLGPVGLVIAAILAVVAVLVLLYTKVDWFREGVNATLQLMLSKWQQTWDSITQKVSSAVGAIQSAVSIAGVVAGNVAGRIQSFFGSAWQSVSGGASRMAGAVSGALGSIGSRASGIAGQVGSFFSNAASRIAGAFSGLAGRISGVFGSIVGAAQNAAGAVAGAFGRIMDMVNTARAAVSSIAGSGSMWVRPVVASNLPDPGEPFYLHANGSVLSPVSWGMPRSDVRTETNVTNISINGALDPHSTARQVRHILEKDARRDGKTIAGGGLW